TGQRCPGGHRQTAEAAEEPLDRRSAQPVALDALRLVLDKTEVERRERRHRPGGAHEVSDARAADLLRELALQPRADFGEKDPVAVPVHPVGKREPLGERDNAQAYADRRADPFILRQDIDRKSTRLNSSHGSISYAVFCLKKNKNCY